MYKNYYTYLCDSSLTFVPPSSLPPSHPSCQPPPLILCQNHNFEGKTPKKKFKKAKSFHGLYVWQNKLEVQKQEISKRREEEELGRDSSAFKNIKKRKILDILQIRELLQKKKASNKSISFTPSPSLPPPSTFRPPPSPSTPTPLSFHFSSKPPSFHSPSSSFYHPNPLTYHPRQFSSSHHSTSLAPSVYYPPFSQIGKKKETPLFIHPLLP